MAKNSNIEWTDATWNPWYGCLKVSPGCKQCYMYRDMKRYGRDPFTVTRAKPPTFNGPLKWKENKKVFTCSWSDFFIAEADEWRDETWDIIKQTPHLTYQILTKRPENIIDRLPIDWGNGYSNVWIGVSVETQDYLWRVETIENIPAAIRFVSYEPALEYVNFAPYTDIINWLISGGESGYNSRPAKLEWFMKTRDMCIKNGIPYFHKQHGGSRKVDNAWGGCKLENTVYNNFPYRIIETSEMANTAMAMGSNEFLQPYFWKGIGMDKHND